MKKQHLALLVVNGITIIRLAIGILSVIFFCSPGKTVQIAALFILLFVSDLLDGFLARRFQVSTKIGGILDSTIDRINYYFVIGLLIRNNVPLLLFLPYFVRDLLDISVQAYINVPKIHGTKVASVGGTISCYAYAVYIKITNIRDMRLECVMFFLMLFSLANMVSRLWSLRERLRNEFAKDYPDASSYK